LIFDQLNLALKNGVIADLSGVVFPGKIDFGNEAEEEILMPGALFIKCIFLNDANFENVVFDNFVYFSDSTFHEQALFINVLFEKKANFNHVKFSHAVFSGEFQNHAYFQGAVFP
jgi:uncharacterized protein YjbI with pentapeptide repeats